MEYNTKRNGLVISEYGRNIQKMAEYACQITDKEERNTAAQAIIDVMGQLNPHLRDVSDFKHKLWTHLFIISDFKLDVNSPYPIPKKNMEKENIKRLPYPNKQMKYKHYGYAVDLLIEKAIAMEEGDGKVKFIAEIANLMKKNYLSWNRDSVNDEMILQHLEKMSGGKLKLSDDFNFAKTHEILARNNQNPKRRNNSGGRQKNNNSRNNNNRNNNHHRNRNSSRNQSR